MNRENVKLMLAILAALALAFAPLLFDSTPEPDTGIFVDVDANEAPTKDEIYDQIDEIIEAGMDAPTFVVDPVTELTDEQKLEELAEGVIDIDTTNLTTEMYSQIVLGSATSSVFAMFTEEQEWKILFPSLELPEESNIFSSSIQPPKVLMLYSGDFVDKDKYVEINSVGDETFIWSKHEPVVEKVPTGWRTRILREKNE